MSTTAYVIDVARRRIRPEPFTGFDDIRRLLGLESVQSFSLAAFVSSNAVYVNDSGFYLTTPHFFRLRHSGPTHPIRGLGLVVGPEVGMSAISPTLDVAYFERLIEFLSYDQATTWILDHAEEPAISINGETKMTWAGFWRTVPRPVEPQS